MQSEVAELRQRERDGVMEGVTGAENSSQHSHQFRHLHMVMTAIMRLFHPLPLYCSCLWWPSVVSRTICNMYTLRLCLIMVVYVSLCVCVWVWDKGMPQKIIEGASVIRKWQKEVGMGQEKMTTNWPKVISAAYQAPGCMWWEMGWKGRGPGNRL